MVCVHVCKSVSYGMHVRMYAYIYVHTNRLTRKMAISSTNLSPFCLWCMVSVTIGVSLFTLAHNVDRIPFATSFKRRPTGTPSRAPWQSLVNTSVELSLLKSFDQKQNLDFKDVLLTHNPSSSSQHLESEHTRTEEDTLTTRTTTQNQNSSKFTQNQNIHSLSPPNLPENNQGQNREREAWLAHLATLRQRQLDGTWVYDPEWCQHAYNKFFCTPSMMTWKTGM
jgi:hypothetical protein